MIYTDEMKREIESHGMMVIEFKMMLKKGTAVCTKVANKIVMVVENIIDVIKELAGKIIRVFEERIEPLFAPLEKLLKKWNIENKKRRFTRSIKNSYRLVIKRPIMIHCINNC